MAATMVIYNLATKRVVFWGSWDNLIPSPDYYNDYDAGSHGYQVGISGLLDAGSWEWNEAAADWRLTDAACTEWGISTAQKAYYKRNLTIAESTTDYVFSTVTKQVTVSAQALADKRKYLTVTLSNANIVADAGLYGLDHLPLDYYHYDGRTWRDRHDPTVGDVIVTVAKKYADGTAVIGDTDAITLEVEGGVLTTTHLQALSAINGQIAFSWRPGIETGVVKFEARSDDPLCDPGTAQIYVGRIPAGTNYTRKTLVRTFALFLPGTLSTTGGGAGDGVVARFYLPEHPKANAAYDYYDIQIHLVEIDASIRPPSGGDLALRFTGETSGATCDVTLSDGQYMTQSAVDQDGFVGGEWVQVQVIEDAGAAADVNIRVTVE